MKAGMFRRGLIWVAGGALLAALGCATPMRPTQDSNGAGPSNAQGVATEGQGTQPVSSVPPLGAGETYGPPPPGAAEAPPTPYGPDPIQVRPVVLVFGPGMARGYAYAGVLRAFHDEEIPIAAIIGTEIGALIGALYAMEGNLNRFEWGLQRFKEDVFKTQSGLLGRILSSSEEKLEASLKQVFVNKDLSEAKIPVRVMLQPVDGSRPHEVQSGNAAEVLRAAVAAPPYFRPSRWKGSLFEAANRNKPLAIAEARALGLGVVIAVVTDNSGSESLNDADIVIRPDLAGIGEQDFQKRSEAAFRGRKAALDARKEIRHWVGLPPADSVKE